MIDNRTKTLIQVIAAGAATGITISLLVDNLDNMPDISFSITAGKKALDRESAYVGSLTLAGVALFGSAYTSRLGILRRTSPPVRRTGAAMITMGAFALAGTHLILATLMCCNDPGPLLPWFAIPTIVCMGVFALGGIFVITSPES